MSFFNLLPTEAVENIIRHISSKPKRPEWMSFIQENDLFSLVSDQGILGVIARQILVKFSIRINVSPRKAFKNEAIISENSLRLQAILDHVGHTVREISFHSSVFPFGSFTFSFQPNLRLLLSAFTSLTHCDLNGFKGGVCVENILCASSVMLKSLVLPQSMTHSYEDAVIRYCKNLERLQFGGRVLRFEMLVETVGISLLDISINSVQFVSTFHAQISLKAVQKHCRSLRRIEIPTWNNYLEHGVAELYMSYGEQLEIANVGNMDPYLCEQIVASCPNVQVDCAGDDRFVAERIKAFGRQLSKLYFTYCSHASFTASDVEKAARSCSNLKSIEKMEGMERELAIIMCVLRGLPRTLIELRVNLSAPLSERVFLSDISVLNGSLAYFSYCSYQLPEPGLFQKIAEENPSLEIVSIFLKLRGYEDDIDNTQDVHNIVPEDVIVNIVKSFARCSHLREFEVNSACPFFDSSIESIADASAPFRNRETVLTVRGREYCT